MVNPTLKVLTVTIVIAYRETSGCAFEVDRPDVGRHILPC